MKRVSVILIALFCLISTQAQQDRQQILKVYNWGDYIGVGVVDKFEKWYKEVTGNSITVEYETYDYPEDCFEKILKGQADIDVFCPPEYIVERMLKNHLLTPIDTSFIEKGIPNWMKGTSPFIDAMLQHIGDTQGITAKDYTVGYLWGTLILQQVGHQFLCLLYILTTFQYRSSLANLLFLSTARCTQHQSADCKYQ